MAKKAGDISVDTLEELVRTNGDGIVIGYVRFKNIKKCTGYKDAKDKAFMRLSRIKGGRRISENEYAAIIRFRWIILVFFLAIFLLFFGIFKNVTKAKVRPYVPELPMETIETTSDNATLFIPETMDIPGFSDLTLDEDEKIMVYNPNRNKCFLSYRFYVGDRCIFESECIKPGEVREADIRKILIKGVYRIKIVTTGHGLNGETLNSVCQEIIATID